MEEQKPDGRLLATMDSKSGSASSSSSAASITSRATSSGSGSSTSAIASSLSHEKEVYEKIYEKKEASVNTEYSEDVVREARKTHLVKNKEERPAKPPERPFWLFSLFTNTMIKQFAEASGSEMILQGVNALLQSRETLQQQLLRYMIAV